MPTPSGAYYNEHDRQKAAWLRELIRRDLIAPGEVDERGIEEVQPNELRGFAQCHFFAGIGVWSHALRNAGWSDDAPVWTGSCPCQPFSSAGEGRGADDSRHLWPSWFRLIRECRPDVVFGEQVTNGAGLAWFDLVSTDLEGAGYAIGAADLCAAGVGAPHIRQRLYFVAESRRTDGARRGVLGPERSDPTQGARQCADTGVGGVAGIVADAKSHRASNNAEARQPHAERNGAAGALAQPAGERCGEAGGEHCRRPAQRIGDASESGELGNADEIGFQGSADRGVDAEGRKATERSTRLSGRHGFWDNAEWISCRDGKARPVEPGTFPLAHGAPARVVRLRGYGDGIVGPLATAFVQAYREVRTA